MKSALNFILLLVSLTRVVAAPLPNALEGIVRGHITGTKPNEYSYTSHPQLTDYGKIEAGTLFFNSHVFKDFEEKESPRHTEYRATSGDVDARIFITKPRRDFYFLTIRTGDGGYGQYQIQKNTETPRPDFEWLASRAKFIAVGTIGPSAAGGGGTTSSIKISDVLVGTLKNESVITVFWATKKGFPSSLDVDVIWFLDASSEHQGAYIDIAPDLAHIPATPENLKLVANYIKKKTEPNPESCVVAKPTTRLLLNKPVDDR
jgi:hypothetical protein